jgi:hypothetical protein
MAVKIQFRRDTAANWQSVNPILSQGELGLDTTNNRFKMGNGSTAWNDLDYTVDFEPNGTYPNLRAQATTKEDVGLGNVTNDAQVKRSEMGQPDGVATLDSSGLIPSSQLPSYVDDVLEFADFASLPTTGETGKIYIAIATGKIYRWSGSIYIEISNPLDIATQAEAQAGSDNTKAMTPLRTKQHVDSRIDYQTTTIATTDWSGTDPVTAVKTVSGVLSTDKPLIDIDLSAVAFANVEAKQTEYAKIYRVAATDDDEITFYALEAPTEELVIQIKVVR